MKKEGMLVCLLAFFSAGGTAAGGEDFTPVGLGGGGAMYAPASSIHDPRLMFTSCDMGGFYRSTDGGATWRLVDFRQTRGSTACRPAFHPRDPNRIYFRDLVSVDRGVTWRKLPGRVPFRGRDVTEIALDPADGLLMVYGTGEGVWVSPDGGRTWKRARGVDGRCVGIFIDPTSPRGDRRVYVATERGVWVSGRSCSVFRDVTAGLPGTAVRDLAGGVTRRGTAVLYCTTASRKRGGKLEGGVFRMELPAGKWRTAMGRDINTRLGRVDRWGAGDIPEYFLLGVAARNADRVFVTCRGTGYWPPWHSTVYRSDDGGRSWRATYNRDFRFKKYPTVEKGRLNVENGWIPYALSWIWGGFHTPSGFYVNPYHPDVLMWTDSGTLDISTDGGRSWRGAYTRYAPGQRKPPYPEPGKAPGRWESVGLEVTTTWEYHVDPFNHRRHYICYTDIGFAVSEDGGRSWRNNSRSSGTPWMNTTYMMVFDPRRKGRIWAAMSNVHDIPHWTHTHDGVRGPGGVCTSDDHGEHWKVTSEGLPSAPCTSIALDPASPPGRRTLYVTMYNHGVYKSVDDGKTWKPVNKGIDLAANNHAFLVKVHPDGTLFCCVTARRTGGRRGRSFPRPGALYRSRNGGLSWENITASLQLHWPTGFDFHPRNSTVIYLAAATIPGGPEGGIYRTRDGGKHWKRLLADRDFAGKGGPSYVHGMFVTVDPRNPLRIYLGTGSHGLWYTLDGGEHWKQSSFPFGSVHRVGFDPDDPRRIYVTTFGAGAWKGAAPVR